MSSKIIEYNALDTSANVVPDESLSLILDPNTIPNELGMNQWLRDSKINVNGKDKDNKKRSFVVAYCQYPQSKKIYEPARDSEWIAKFFGMHVFPERDIIIKPVVAIPSFLPNGVSAETEEGMRLLGLIDVDIRFCQFGSTEMVKLMTAPNSIKNGKIEIIEKGKLFDEFRNKAIDGSILDNLFNNMKDEGKGSWTHNKRIYWPRNIELIVNKATLKPVKPFLVRENSEPWVQTVKGLSLWFEAKRDISKFDSGRISLYQPYLVNSFGKRLPPHPGDQISIWAKRAGPLYENLEDIVLRPLNFNATSVRLKKKYFATFVNGHCRLDSGKVHTEGTIIREIFTYALHKGTKKPVHNLGSCPVGSDGAIKAGLTVEERQKLSRNYFSSGTIDIYRDHKFCITFENSHVEGYLTEKLLNGYASTSVPIYFGSDEATVQEFLNPNAFIHCHLPMNLTSEYHLGKLKQDICSSTLSTKVICEKNFRLELQKMLEPYFNVCIQDIIKVDNDNALYEHMISQNIVPYGRELSGLFNGTLTGELVRTVFAVLGFDE